MNFKSIARKVTIAGATTFALSMLVSVVPAQEVKAAYGRYELVWSDEFTGTSLDKQTWEPLIGNGGEHNNPGWGNNEFEYYTDHEGKDGNILVSDGTLKIIARKEVTQSTEKDPNGPYNFTSARIVSSGKQSFKYGKIEARIKLPKVTGAWPAFWMMGYNEKGWPYCGEIDILEAWNQYDFVQGAWHWSDTSSTDYGGHRYNYKQCTSTTPLLDFEGMRQTDASGKTIKGWENFDKSQWHTYGVIWDEDAIRFTVDDKIYWYQAITDEMTEARGEYYFLLNLAVGGNLPGFTVDESSFPVTMEVDYVRVYQRSGEKGGNSKTSNGWRNKPAQYKITAKDGTKTYYNGMVYDGETIILPNTLTKKGYVFKGFYNQYGKKITSDTRLDKAMTITAKWEKIKVPTAKVKATAKKKAIVVKATATGAKGIQVKYSTKKSMAGAKTKNVTAKTVTLKNLKAKKTYYVKVRAYKLDPKKNKVWGKWSKAVKVTTK